MHWRSHEAGVEVKPLNSVQLSSTDGTAEANGVAVDREYTTSPTGSVGLFESAKVAIAYDVGSSGASISWNIQDSSDGAAGWTDFYPEDGSTANSFTVDSVGGDQGVHAVNYDLSGAKRYVRVQVNPDTAGEYTGIFIMGGGDYIPMS